MTRGYAASLGVAAGTLAVLLARPAIARADERVCARVAVAVDAAVLARWPGLLDDVRDAFDGRGGVDRCARVDLAMQGGALTVGVALADGRSASRAVSRREDVVPTLEALLLVPRIAPPPASPPALPPTTAPAFPRDVAPGARATPPGEASHLRVELSVLSGARVGDGQASLGLGALSFVDIDHWLVGFEARGDRYQARAPASDASPSDGAALELAARGGRRFPLGSVSLDLDAGFAVALQGTATFETSTRKMSSSSDVPRLLLGARMNVGPRSILRGFLGVDGELGPSRASDTDVPGAPHLPIWTVGLALGATVGTL